MPPISIQATAVLRHHLPLLLPFTTSPPPPPRHSTLTVGLTAATRGHSERPQLGQDVLVGLAGGQGDAVVVPGAEHRQHLQQLVLHEAAERVGRHRVAARQTAEHAWSGDGEMTEQRGTESPPARQQNTPGVGTER